MKFEDISQEAELIKKSKPATRMSDEPAEDVPIPGHIRLEFARRFGAVETLNDEQLHWLDQRLREEGLL